MTENGRRCRTMHHLSTAFLIIALAIVVNQGGGVTADDDSQKSDQVAEETKHKAVTIIDGPKYVTIQNPNQPPTKTNHTHQPEQRPPSKPPLTTIPDKQGTQKFVEIPRQYYGQVVQKIKPRHHPKQPLVIHHSRNSVYKFPRVIPLPPYSRKYYYTNQSAQRPLVSAASSLVITKSPKFSIPVQTINGVRTDFVRPPKLHNNTTTSTTTTTTTQRPLRTKRIWPKKLLKKTTVFHNRTQTTNMTETYNTSTSTNDTDHDAASSHIRFVYIDANTTETSATTRNPLRRGYVKWNGTVKTGTTTPSNNVTQIEPNDWIPLVPSYYSKSNLKRPPLTRISKRSDVLLMDPGQEPAQEKRMLYLQSYGLVPIKSRAKEPIGSKKMLFFRKRKRTLNPYIYSGYSPKPSLDVEDLHTDASHHPHVITKIKHHHHHHHHRYIKTIEKPIKVPYKVEVPMPYPVPVEKKIHVPIEKIKVVEKPVPYPVTVEKRVPYPVEVKVPHPVPVKVIEKEYVPKPYPVLHHVPVVKHVEVKVPQPVPVHVEKRVPYPVPVKVPVPVDRPVPVTVEKKVPYPVPFKVLVPQPYPVETKVPYPIEIKVKEPYEVIKHVPIRVPVPQPYPVTVKEPVPVHVEKRVPYPVEVEKKVPVPVEVVVPQKVEVEKKVPVYVPKPYPVEKKVPVPFRVPYLIKVPVKVPVEVPVRVPVYIHHNFDGNVGGSGEQILSGATTSGEVTSAPHTVTVHGNSGFNGFQSRSDNPDVTTPTPRA